MRTTCFTNSHGVFTVRVSRQRCQGHARCVAIAPELFKFDELGYAHAIEGGVLSSDLKNKAQLAAAACPEFAIEILKDQEVLNECA
jgi:ferredoxin